MENKSNFKKTFVDSLFYKTPILSLFMGLTLVVIATNRVETSLIISVIVFVDLLISNLIISLLKGKLTRISSYILDTLISATVAMIFQILLDKFATGLMNADEAKYSILLFAVVPFVATNSIAIAKCKDDLNRGILDTFADALGSGISFAILLIVIALIREILSTGAITFVSFSGKVSQGKLWDSSKFSLSLMSRPFGGLLLVGLFSGLALTFIKKHEEKEKEIEKERISKENESSDAKLREAE